MNNRTSAIWFLLLAVLACAQVARACDDKIAALQCHSDYTDAIAGLNAQAVCPHMATFETCIKDACGDVLTKSFQDALAKAKESVDCSGSGAVAFSPLLLMATIMVFLNVVLG